MRRYKYIEFNCLIQILEKRNKNIEKLKVIKKKKRKAL